jgi:hypothetical protein
MEAEDGGGKTQKKRQSRIRLDSNGFDGEQLDHFLRKIDEADAELASMRGSYMADCKGPRGRIKDIMNTAREAGVNLPAFRVLVEEHRTKRKQEAKRAALEFDERDAYNTMVAALGPFGDTPLGEAALAKAKPSSRGEQALDGLAEEPARPDEEQLNQVGRG